MHTEMVKSVLVPSAHRPRRTQLSSFFFSARPGPRRSKFLDYSQHTRRGIPVCFFRGFVVVVKAQGGGWGLVACGEWRSHRPRHGTVFRSSFFPWNNLWGKLRNRA